MEKNRTDLYAYFGRERAGKPRGFLYSYRHTGSREIAEKKRSAILIFPGGGYSFVSEREWEPVALYYYGRGLDAFVLDYNVAPDCGYPTLLLEAGMAMLYLRREARDFPDARKVAVVGFSAGGHLAGCISYLWDDPALQAAFGAECGAIRPDAAILSYAVVTADERYWHRDSFQNFCGDKAAYEAYSLEKHIRREAPPTFLWATTPDDCVPVENSLLLYTALHRAGVSAEMHLFEEGWHGLSTADIEVCEPPLPSFLAHVRNWLPLSLGFLRAHGFTVGVRER